MRKALYVILASSILMLPGCTFYSWGDGVKARKVSELADISPVVYVILSVFCVILIVSIACALFRKAKENPDDTLVASFTALIATLVILLLVG